MIIGKVTFAVAGLGCLATLLWLMLHGVPIGAPLDGGPLTILGFIILLSGGGLLALEETSEGGEDE